jgi:ABC-type lipoprotein release transport system permease subunit
MPFLYILRLALRNLREAKLRALLTTMGIIVGVAVIVTMVSFGLGLQRNTVERFREMDLFNEARVFGRGLVNLATTEANSNSPGNANGRSRRAPQQTERKAPTRILDDAAISEIARIPGVAYVEPAIFFSAYLRVNNRVLMQSVSGASVPNEASRFKQFAAGGMIGSPDALEALVDEGFVEDFGFEKASDAVGQWIEFLAPPKDKKNEAEEDETPNFFGIPLEEDDQQSQPAEGLVARKFRIVGVLKDEITDGPPNARRVRGMAFSTPVYVPLQAARTWTLEHRSPMNEVALELARERGVLKQDETEGYDSAVVRVTNPVVLSDVQKRLNEMGFSTFSILDQLKQIQVFFLIINSALGLLGGISLLVASFGIANTMIMSILERTREIGIMKAIGAEDREIKFIFFVEAAVMGLMGGLIGCLAAWGIDALANRLAYRFILKPQGVSFIDFFALPPYLWLGAILFALVVSILAALYPAARAARIDPVKALRHD